MTRELPIQRVHGGNISVQLAVEHFRAYQTYSISYLIEAFFGNVTANHSVVTDPTVGEIQLKTDILLLLLLLVQGRSYIVTSFFFVCVCVSVCVCVCVCVCV